MNLNVIYGHSVKTSRARATPLPKNQDGMGWNST